MMKKHVVLERHDMARILGDSNLGTLRDFERLGDGAYGVTYKASVEDPGSPQFVVQIRYHGNVESTNTLQKYLREASLSALPIPNVYAAVGKGDEGLQLQITEFIPGVMADSIYYNLNMDGKKAIVGHMARSFAGLWESPISKQVTGIGKAVISPGDASLPAITVIAERQSGIGGPRIGGRFESVSSYLKAWVRHRFARLEAQNGVDEYKAQLLEPIRQFVETDLEPRLPTDVDEIPVVLMHADMGLHNIIVSPKYPHDFQAVIDWESIAGQPFLVAVPNLIEPLFQKKTKEKRQTVGRGRMSSGQRSGRRYPSGRHVGTRRRAGTF
ncbi:phosphotransferase [Candidatus Bathyarchaeota archaeon]|nr:phosphotransferase [Candidatus Bathyarchaeota archaeon]